MDSGRRSRFGRAWSTSTAALLLLAPEVAAQTGSIAGRVVDAQSGQTVPAAQVFISALDIGVLTQQNGSYLLLNVPAGQHAVTVQRIGYREAQQTASVAAGETVVLDFSITEQALQLDEIIITGTPGGTQRRAIGNTVTTVSVADVTQDVAITGIQDLLTGRTPGLQFTRLSGIVGLGSPMKIRGVGSFNLDQNPLVYVDGIRVDNRADAGPGVADDQGVNVLDDFNPEDIESIEIIKGPAAASLYGTEASAGVIQIITKRGREGAPEFNISVRQGLNYVRDPAGRLGTMYACPTNPAPGLAAGFGCDEESELVPYNMYDEANRYIQEGYFPWETENLYQNGLAQSYNLDVRGGTQTINYFLSANYDNEEGFVYYNKDETFRLRANVGVVFSEMVTLDVSTGYVDGYTQFSHPVENDGGEWQDMLWSNGYYLDRVTPFDTPPTPGVTGSGGDARLGGFQEKIPSDIPENEATREYNRFTGSATLRFQTPEFAFGNVTGSVTQRAVVGIDKSWDVNRNVMPLESGEIPAHLAQYFAAGAIWKPAYSENTLGRAIYERPIITNLSFDYALTGNLRLNDSWGFASSFGAQFNVKQEDFFGNEGDGFASPLSRTINQISQANILTRYSLIENRSLGLYVQEEVSYGDRIFLTGALRFDDNSTFGTEAPAQTYPKLSGSWVVSEEAFWPTDIFNSLRLRGAWGKAGRQPDALAQFNVYAPVPGPGGQPALRASQPGNPGVQPEVSTELELGFDFAILEDRVSGEFTHYWRKDEQALLPLSIPGSWGFPGSVEQNLGQIDNWGWEARVGTRLYESEGFSFDLDLMADHVDNEIKSLGDYAGTTEIAIGFPYPNQVTGDWVASADWDPSGSFANVYDQRLNAQCYVAQSLAPPGTSPVEAQKYGNVRGSETGDCRQYPNQNILVGPAFATYTFSVAPRISLLNNQLQIFALAQGEYGRTREESGHTWSHIYNNSKISRLENDPLWVASQILNGNSSNDLTKGLYDGDFWKLREVGLRYSLPQSLIQRTGASRASIAFSAREIWTLWQKQPEIYGLPVTDPEFGTPSLDGDSNFREAPPISSVSVTLRVTF